MSVPVRTLVAWCPDWPVVATGVDLAEPVAVVYANRIVAASPGARAQGTGPSAPGGEHPKKAWNLPDFHRIWLISEPNARVIQGESEFRVGLALAG